jgi:predicted RNA-binding protein (TIGR00451 family)
MPVEPVKPKLHEYRRIRMIAAFQFGKGAERFFPRTVRIVKSPHTHKIRHIYSDNVLIATLRAKDGFLALTLDGGRALKRILHPPRHRVRVVRGIEEFILRGGDVFAKHVVSVDPELRPEEEVLVVDSRDRLLAVGRSFFNAGEMLSFRVGVAVKVRHGAEKL